GTPASGSPGVLVNGASGAVTAGWANDPRSPNVRIVSGDCCRSLLNELEGSVGTARRRMNDSGAAPAGSDGIARRASFAPAPPGDRDSRNDRRGVSRLLAA